MVCGSIGGQEWNVSSSTVTLRLVDDRGGELGEVDIEAKRREPSFQHRTKDGRLSVFVADKQGDDGVWVYRRVGVEREA